LPSAKNIKSLEELKEKLNRAKTVILADYKGLSVAQLTSLRQKLKEAGGEIKVSKNTLLQLAFKNQHYQLPKEVGDLTGPTAIVFAFEDEILAVKALYQFSQENSLPKLKAGFLGKDFLSRERIKQLGALPDKEILLARVVGSLNSPMGNLVNVLQGNLRKLVLVLEAVKEKKN